MCGTANPLHPISSKMPALNATAIPTSTRLVRSVAVRTPALKLDDIRDSVNNVEIHTSGAMRSAAAYQRDSTCHRMMRDKRSRMPVLPSRSAVSRRLEMLGPASMATTAYAKRGSAVGEAADMSDPPMARNTPPHEIANVRTKYELTGCL